MVDHLNQNEAMPSAEVVNSSSIIAERDALLSQQSILGELRKDVKKAGFAGDTRHVELVYLATRTRFFDKPVSVVIKGSSGGGKSHTVDTALKFVPETAYVRRSGMSRMAFIHSNEDFRHKHLYIEEFAGMQAEDGSPFLRMMLSSGKIQYERVNMDKKSDSKAELLTKDGPMGLIMTTTQGSLHPEDESRMLSITLPDRESHIRAVLDSLAERYADGTTVIPLDYERWHAIDDWMSTTPVAVKIPFAQNLLRRVGTTSNRITRQMPMILELIKAHAWLHYMTRKRGPNGEVIASLADYEVVYHLVADLIEESAAEAIAPQIRDVVQAVASVTSHRPEYEDGCPNFIIKPKIDSPDPSTVSRRVAKAIDAGFLKNNAGSRGVESRLVLGDRPLPETTRTLPAPDDLKQ